MAEQDIKDIVKQKYGQAALRVVAGSGSSCCGSASSRGECDPITSNLYGQETAGLPQEAVAAAIRRRSPS